MASGDNNGKFMKGSTKKRKRLGGTSPVLIGVHPNPGPKVWRRKRKVSKEVKNSKKRRRKLDDMSKGRLLMCFDLNLPIKEIARRLKIAPTTVRLWRNRYCETGEVKRKSGSGRPPVLSARDQFRLRYLVMRDPKLTARQLLGILNGATQTKASMCTVKRALCRHGFFERVARRKPYISDVNKQARLRWCAARKHWTAADWAKVVWTDESSVISCCG